MLTAAIAKKVVHYLDWRENDGETRRRLVDRSRRLPDRQITTRITPVVVSQPRVFDYRSAEQREVFSLGLLPQYLLKTKSIEYLIPWLYLKGISTNDFPEGYWGYCRKLCLRRS